MGLRCQLYPLSDDHCLQYLQVIVNMSHAAIVNPLANLGPPMFPMGNRNTSTPEQQYGHGLPQLAAAPQMPMLKPAPSIKCPSKEKVPISKELIVKLNSDGKPIKKGELDPSTMVHVPGGTICTLLSSLSHLPICRMLWCCGLYVEYSKYFTICCYHTID